MPGHPHAAPHFVFLPPPQHTPIAATAISVAPIAEKMATGAMAMGAGAHQASGHEQAAIPDCGLVDNGGVARGGAPLPLADSLPAGQAYPSLLAVSLMLLVTLVFALLRPANRHGFHRWLKAWWPAMLDLRIPTPPPRCRPCALYAHSFTTF